MIGGGGKVEEDILVLDLGTTGAGMALGTKEGRGNENGDEGRGRGEDFGKFRKPRTRLIYDCCEGPKWVNPN